jgi:transposase
MDAKDRLIAQQAKEIIELKALLQAALEKIALLESQLKKNSGNSSKPPSSDIVKPPKTQNKSGKQPKLKQGAQPGHEQHLRQPIAPEQIDEIIKLELAHCPDCGHPLDLDSAETKTFQQIEFIDKPFVVTEYQQLMYWCKNCQCYHYARLPEVVEKSGLFGTNMTALTGYLKGRSHMSYRTLQAYFHDVVGIDISTGFLAKQIKKVSVALQSPYEELADFLTKQSHLHIDETSFKKNGKLQWAWCFVAEFFTFFKIDASRGSKVLHETLGEDFLGSISSDFFSAYLRYKKETETLFQFCWAHLIREIKFLMTLDDTKVYGKRLLKYVKAMFSDIHRQDELTEVGFKRLMHKHKKAIMKTVRRSVPEHKKSSALAKRFEEQGESYFLFIENPAKVEPTNNVAEREIRTLVLDRLVTQGVRSERGNEWHARFWTVLATCRRRGMNVMSFLRESLYSVLHGLSPPSLLPVLAEK